MMEAPFFCLNAKKKFWKLMHWEGVLHYVKCSHTQWKTHPCQVFIDRIIIVVFIIVILLLIEHRIIILID